MTGCGLRFYCQCDPRTRRRYDANFRIAFYSYPFDRIKRLYDINVHGAFFTAREAARHMIPQGGGSIVLVSSMSANVSLPSSDTLVKPDKVY